MKSFTFAIWPNQYKQAGSQQPDATGNIQIPIEVLKELSVAYQKGELPTSMVNETEVVKLGASAWRNAPDGNQPVIKAQIRSWAEEQEAAAKRAERTAKDQGASNSDDTGWGVPF